MNIDRKDIVIFLLSSMVVLEMVAILAFSGVVRYAFDNSVDRREVEQVVRLSERVMSVNDLCVRLRSANAPSALPWQWAMGADHGEVCNEPSCHGEGL